LSDGLHHEIAVSETGMECCAMNDKTGHRRPPGKFKLLGLSGIPLLEGKSVLTNDPSNHPQSAGLPEGHTKINSFLGVPFVTNGKTVGMIAVANREGGYRPEDQMILEALAPTILQEILRKRAEMAFKENQEILKTIIESTTDFISLKDADGKYLVLNSTAESILKNASGFSRAEIIGKRDADLLLPEFTIMENRADSRVMNTGTTQIYDNTFKFDLREITYSIIKSPCFDDKGKISGIVTIARDISTKKRDDEKIKSLLREKELLLKEVHHRIKNNMNTINALLLMHADDIEDIVANNALKEAGSLVKSMMILYEKLYSSPNYENLRVKEYLTALIDEVIGIFPKGKTVKVEKRIDDFILEAKKLQPISIIINELITNIMKYSFVNREEGKIFISLTNNENKVNLIIQDNGIGMPEFIDFEQSPGFGLTLVKILTEQISGKIWIERQNGTAVILEFEI